MGVGKSTIGKSLADKLSYKFIDIDYIIEKKERNSIDKIFREKGENYFRQFIKVNKKKYILDAEIYLPKANLVSSEPWDYDDWYKNDMKNFFENEFDLNGVK